MRGQGLGLATHEPMEFLPADKVFREPPPPLPEPPKPEPIYERLEDLVGPPDPRREQLYERALRARAKKRAKLRKPADPPPAYQPWMSDASLLPKKPPGRAP